MIIFFIKIDIFNEINVFDENYDLYNREIQKLSKNDIFKF